jgi:hypothetical protein
VHDLQGVALFERLNHRLRGGGASNDDPLNAREIVR